jgi:hypothetical protein
MPPALAFLQLSPVPDWAPFSGTGLIRHLHYFLIRYRTDRMTDSLAFRHLQKLNDGSPCTYVMPVVIRHPARSYRWWLERQNARPYYWWWKDTLHVHTAGGGQECTLHVHIWLVVVLNLLCDVNKS